MNPIEVLELTAGSKVSFKWFGTTQAFSDSEKQDVAEQLDTDVSLLSLSKVLINTKNEHYKKLTKLRSQIRKYWFDLTLPWVEKGVRLLLRTDQPAFEETMQHFADDMFHAASNFSTHWYDILAEAEEKLGPKLFNRADYPANANDLFNVGYSWPNLNPPDYLSPAAYNRELQLRCQQIETSVKIFEEKSIEQLTKMVERLSERLKPNEDGTPKKFHDSTVECFTEFFEGFQKLNFNKGSELESLVAKAKQMVNEVDPIVLRVDKKLKKTLSEQTDELLEHINQCPLLKQKRRVVERGNAEAASPPSNNTPPVSTADPSAAATTEEETEPAETVPVVMMVPGETVFATPGVMR